MYDFKERYAAVTGAGKGIGLAIASRLLRDGAEGVAMLDLDEALVKASAAQLGPGALPIPCDVSDEHAVHAAFQQVFDRFGRVDILVNNAGITLDAMFHKMDPAHFKKVIDVHLYGTYHCCREVIPGMRARAYGKIVNLSSTSSFGNPGQSNYAAAKSAIDGLTRTLAKELARKQITVNSIAPGFIRTDIVKTMPPEVLKAKVASTPMQRFGEPDEVAAVAAFLASDESSFVSGAQILCCGAATTRG